MLVCDPEAWFGLAAVPIIMSLWLPLMVLGCPEFLATASFWPFFLLEGAVALVALA